MVHNTMMVVTMMQETMKQGTEICLILAENMKPMVIIMESVSLPSDGLNTPTP